MIEISGVHVDNLSKLKTNVWSMLKKAVDASGDPVEKVWEALERGEAALVLAIDKRKLKGICVTETISNSKEKLLNIWALAGEDMSNWIDGLDKLESWAYENAYDAVIIQKGRPGWQRYLSDRDYELKFVYLRKNLS